MKKVVILDNGHWDAILAGTARVRVSCRVMKTHLLFLTQIRTKDTLSIIKRLTYNPDGMMIGDRGVAILRMNTNSIDHGIDYTEVESALRHLDGVTNAIINHVENTIKVEFDPRKLTLEEVRNRLKEVLE